MTKEIILMWILLLLSYTGFSQQTCNQTFTASGLDFVGLSISSADITCNAGGAISSITLNPTSNFSDYDCGNSYEFDLWIDNVPVTGCRSDFDNTDLTGFSTLSIYSMLNYGFGINITIEVELTVTYAACPAPFNLAASNTTASGVDLVWDSVTAATSGYDWRIMEDGDDPNLDTPVDSANGVAGTSVSSSVVLSSNTNYDAYVKSDCGGGDESDWSSKVDFKTDCTDSIPYTEDFESGRFYECWSRTDTGESFISINCGSNTSSFLQINGGTHTTETDIIDVSGETSIDVSYEINNGCFFQYLSVAENLTVDYWDGNAWQNIVTYASVNVATSWTPEKFTITTGLTADFKLRFDRSGGSSGFDDLDIDDLVVEATPSCLVPTGLATSNITVTSVDLDWNSVTAATSGYDWVIMADGDDPNVDTPVDSANGVSGTSVSSSVVLSSNTNYDAYVRSDCGGSHKSDWSSVESFSTSPANDDACDAIALTIDATSAGDAYTSVASTEQTGEPDMNLNSGVNNSVWFTFVAPTYGNVQVTTDIAGGTLTDTEIAVYSTTDCSDFTTYDQIGFDQNGGSTVNSNSVLNLYDLSADDTYYIQVDRYDGFGTTSGGTFGIEVRNLSYVYNGTSWSPQTPGGNSTADNDLVIQSGTAPIATATTANEVIVEAGAVLDLNADLTADVTFHSDVSGTAQLADATGKSITGDVTVERFIPVQTEDTRAWRFLTSSVDSDDPIYDNWQESGNSPAGFGTHISGSTAGDDGFDQTVSGVPSMYTFDNTFTGNQNDAWEAVPNTDTKKLVAGEAYRMFIRGDRNYNLNALPGDPDFGPNNDVTLRATGSLTIGNHTHTLSDKADYYSLVGNPYQAVVDFNDLTTTNVNTNNYYVWDANVSTRGAYVTHNLSTGINDLVSSAVNEFIMPGQSFFVQTVNDGTASLGFTESAKDVNATQITVFSDDGPSYINLLLYKDQDLINGGSESDGIVVLFNDIGNNNVDQKDATKLGNPDENLARFNNGQYLSIEERANPMGGESLELYTAGYSVSNYTFSLNTNNINSDVNVYLVDNYTGNSILMSGSDNQYNFNLDANIPESVASDRFSLEFEIDTFGIEDNESLNDFKVYPNPVSDGNVTIQAPNMSGEVNISLYNMIGQRVMSMKEELSDNGKASLNIDKQQSGVYFIEVSQDGQNAKERLIIK